MLYFMLIYFFPFFFDNDIKILHSPLRHCGRIQISICSVSETRKTRRHVKKEENIFDFHFPHHFDMCGNSFYSWTTSVKCVITTWYSIIISSHPKLTVVSLEGCCWFIMLHVAVSECCFIDTSLYQIFVLNLWPQHHRTDCVLFSLVSGSFEDIGVPLEHMDRVIHMRFM